MPNPYYIPRRQDTGIRDLASLGLQLYGLKQHRDISMGQQALTAKEHLMRGETIQLAKERQEAELGVPPQPATMVEPGSPGIPGLEQQKIDVTARHAASIEEQNKLAGQKLSPRDKNWGLGDYTMFGARLRQAGFEPDKLDFMKELKVTAMDNNINRGKFAEDLKVNWEQGGRDLYVTQLQESVDAKLKKMSPEELSRGPDRETQKQLRLIDQLQGLKENQVIPTFFPDIAQHDVMESKKALPTYNQVIAEKVSRGEVTSEEAATLIRPQPERGTPSWHTVTDPKSPTGYSYQNLNEPTAPLRTGAPKPSSVHEPTFKDKMLQNVWGRLDDQSRLKVLGALPPEKDLTEKNILDVYGNIFTDAETKKALQPIVEEITKKAAAKNVPPGKKTSILPQGAKQIGTLNGKPVYEGADGKRFVQE